MSNPIRLATAALSGRIFAGRPTKDGMGFKEPRYDVTSDALKAVMDHIGLNRQADIVSEGEVVCTIRIVAPKATTANAVGTSNASAQKPLPETPVGWQDISTHDGSRDPVLLWFPDFAAAEEMIGVWRPWREPFGGMSGGDWLDRDTGEPFETMASEVFPTHWQPLPAPPVAAQPRVDGGEG